MISGPFVLRKKTKAAPSAPVELQPAQPVARVLENTSTCSNGFILKNILRGGAIVFSVGGISWWIMGLVFHVFDITMLGLFFLLLALFFGHLSMAVD